MNLKKENQISTPLEKGMRWEMIFRFFHLFYHILPHLLGGEKDICHSGQKKSFSF